MADPPTHTEHPAARPVGRPPEGRAPLDPISPAASAVSNPLTVIAIFVLLVEAVATVTLVQIVDSPHAGVIANFVVGFPVLIALFFFMTLWLDHTRLYSPKEFRSDEGFLKALNRRVEKVELRQEADEVDVEQARPLETMQMVDRLLGLDDVRGAVRFGRNFLIEGQSEEALAIFDRILGHIGSRHGERYYALANRGYALNALGRHREAAAAFQEVARLTGRLGVYHQIALALAQYRLGEAGNAAEAQAARETFARLARMPGYVRERRLYEKMAPDFIARMERELGIGASTDGA